MAYDKNYRRRKRGAVIYTPIAALLIIVIVIFGISVFFRVSNIEVTGAKKYTSQQIISASGIKNGDNLVFIDPDAAAKTIKTNLPYLSDVEVDKVVPDKVEIVVTESQPIAVISFDGANWILDQKARVLEKADSESGQNKIEVTGVTPTATPIGLQFTVADSDQIKLTYLANVLTALQGAGIAGDVKSIDMSNIGGIKFSYADRFTVTLGNGDAVDYKMVKLHDVMAQLQPDDKGKIDLSNNPARFIPDSASPQGSF